MTSFYPEDGASFYLVMMIMQLVLHYATHRFFTFIQNQTKDWKFFHRYIFHYPAGESSNLDRGGTAGLLKNFPWWFVPFLFVAVVLSGGSVMVYFTKIKGK